MTFNFNEIHRRIYYLILLLIPTQLGYHFWPEWSLVLGRRIDYLSPTLYLTDILIAFLCFFWFLSGPRKNMLRIRRLPVRHAVAFWGMVFLFFLAVVNSLFSVSAPESAYKWLKVFELVVLAGYIIVTRPDKQKSVRILVASAVFSVALGFTQVVLGHSVGGVFRLAGERTFTLETPEIAKAVICFPGRFGCREILRPYATFPHPNVLAGYITAIFFLSLPYGTRRLHQQTEKLAPVRNLKAVGQYAPLAILLAGIFMTFSRSAWLALGVGGLLYSLTTDGFSLSGARAFRKLRTPLRAASVIGGISLVFLSAGIFSGYREFLASGISISERRDLAQAAVLMFRDHPLIGSGLGTFISLSPTILRARETYILQPAHSVYLLIIAETGIIGTLFSFICLIRILGKLRRRTIAASLPLATILFIGTVDHYPLTIQQGQLILTVVSAILFTEETRDTGPL